MWAAELLLQSASHSSSVEMSEYNWESCSADDKRCQCTTKVSIKAIQIPFWDQLKSLLQPLLADGSYGKCIGSVLIHLLFIFFMLVVDSLLHTLQNDCPCSGCQSRSPLNSPHIVLLIGGLSHQGVRTDSQGGWGHITNNVEVTIVIVDERFLTSICSSHGCSMPITCFRWTSDAVDTSHQGKRCHDWPDTVCYTFPIALLS
jgi:hypothetical protein